MTSPSLFRQVLDFSHRADPFPLYRQLRERPVWREDDGFFVVSTYREITALLHDPRVSSDPRCWGPDFRDLTEPTDVPGSVGNSFLRLDPPRHDLIRRLATRQFGPPHRPGLVSSLRPLIGATVAELIDGLGDRDTADIVDDLAYPLPVAVICRLLGVPVEDEPRFRGWVEPIVKALGITTPEDSRRRDEAFRELGAYLGGLAEQRRTKPGDDLISGFVTDDGPEGRIDGADLLSTLVVLLVAGHETTVNLIANGTLTLLRHPEWLDRLRMDPGLSVPIVEELLRYEPSVHMLANRTTIADIRIAGERIAKGHPLVLLVAAGSRDPAFVEDPDRFDPGRPTTQHLGFGSGIHYCFGAPLARLEAQVALAEIARRLTHLRLIEDPPPYRPSAVLRGPIHLRVAYDDVRPRPDERLR